MMYKVTFTFDVWAHEFPDLHPDTKIRESFHVSANNQSEAFVSARNQAEKYANLLGYGGTCLPAITDKKANIVIHESSKQELDAELDAILSDPLFANL